MYTVCGSVSILVLSASYYEGKLIKLLRVTNVDENEIISFVYVSVSSNDVAGKWCSYFRA